MKTEVKQRRCVYIERVWTCVVFYCAVVDIVDNVVVLRHILRVTHATENDNEQLKLFGEVLFCVKIGLRDKR
jgi:hypothetical protein